LLHHNILMSISCYLNILDYVGGITGIG
jgi:hypothetical protein